ncbi:MAG: hypothetical protein WD060_09340 [Pirellulales bacterium]
MDAVDQLLAEHAPWAGRDLHWPLTPFESFLWFDDRPQFPLLFRVDLRFDGRIDTESMRGAYRFALGRHPLLRSTIRAVQGAATWHAAATGWQELELLSKEVSDEPRMEWVDLTQVAGLRGGLRQTDTGWDVRLEFHHACCDGQGARMFIQDLVMAYAVLRKCCEHATPFLPIDISHLDRRGQFTGPGAVIPHLRRMRSTLRLLTPRPRPAAKVYSAAMSQRLSTPPTASTALQPTGLCSHTFQPDVVLQLQDVQRHNGASFNDVAVAILFEVLGRWQRDHGASARSWIRIAVPVDLRSREDERLPAANRYTYLFLNRRAEACGEWSGLLAGVQAELQAQRQSREGLCLLATLGIISRWPRLLRWVLRLPLCLSTAVLTNLSDPTRRLRKRLPVDADGFFWLDGARCYDVRVVTPPLRPQTHWGLGLVEYAGRMTVLFRYDATTIDAEAAERVKADYVAALSQWLESS